MPGGEREKRHEAEKKQQQTEDRLESAGQVTEAQDSILKVYASRHTSEKAMLESQVSLLSTTNMALMTEKSEYMQRYVAAAAEAKSARPAAARLLDARGAEGDKRMIEAEKRKTAELAGRLQDRADKLELEYWKKEGEVLAEQRQSREIQARAAEVINRHARGLTATMAPPMGQIHAASQASPTHLHSLSLTPSLTLTHSHTHTLTHSHSLTHSLTHPLTHSHSHVHMHTDTHPEQHFCICAHKNTHTHTHTQIHTHTHTYTYIIYIYVYIYIHMYICIHMYVYIYTTEVNRGFDNEGIIDKTLPDLNVLLLGFE